MVSRLANTPRGAKTSVELRRAAEAAPRNPPKRSVPLHQQIRSHVLNNIMRGVWPPESQLPSEHELMETFQVSRMTVHHVLKDLSREGIVTRVQGSGTFVALPSTHSTTITFVDIVGRIKAAGHEHRVELLECGASVLSETEAASMRMRAGGPVFRYVALHLDDGEPVQLEVRVVNCRAAPDFLTVDHRQNSAGTYLSRLYPYPSGTHTIRAVTATDAQREHLRLRPGEPCLEVERTTWVGRIVVTNVRLVHPASRYEISGDIETVMERGTTLADRGPQRKS